MNSLDKHYTYLARMTYKCMAQQASKYMSTKTQDIQA